jgi:mannose-6-phosphate isomerase class I
MALSYLLSLPINTQVYAPPDKAVTEFEMERTVVNGGEVYAPKASGFGSVILVLEGEGVATVGSESVAFHRGGLFFQSAGSEVTITGSEDGKLVYFRATKKGAIA